MQQALLAQNNILLVPNVAEPEELCSNLTVGRVIRHPRTGAEIVATRHTLESVWQLRQQGVNAPSPILTQYKWTGRHAPFSHQRETAAFLTMHRRALVLSDMGTGKTAAAMWAADYLKRMGYIRKVLVFAPLSCLNRVWMDEMFTWIPHRSGEVLHATRDKRKYMARRSDADYLITNHDGFKVIRQELLERGDIDLIIYDEASALRNAQIARYKMFRDFVNAIDPWLWLMTGTPTPNAPTDAWALARLVNPGGVTTRFTQFRESTMWKATPFKWRERNNAKIIVRAALQPAIRHRKDECIDLPPTMYTQRECAMSKEQAFAFAGIKKHMRVEAAAAKREDPKHQITALNAATKLMKLLQICVGSVYDDDGKVADLPMDDRLSVMSELIEAAQGKVIIYTAFRHTIRRVVSDLTRRGITSVAIHGGVTGKARDHAIFKFQNEVNPHVLVAQARTASHGLNLTVADTIIWFGPMFSAEQYQQANERMARPGQTMHMTVAHLGCHAVEWGAYSVVADKTASQNAILSLYEKVIRDDD